MAFRRTDLQVAFSVPGTHDFTVWGYGTTDPLAEVLRPGYLLGRQSLLRAGDLVYVRTRPGRDPVDGAREVGETRTALAMVSCCENGDASLRLVQDFGPPAGDGPGAAAEGPPPAAPAAATPAAGVPIPVPAKRGRGRPPGSRSKPAATA
jgi:hypothetical protein